MVVNSSRSKNYLNIINEFAINLVKLTTENDIIWFTTNEVISKLDFVDCVIYLLDDSKRFLIQRAAYGPKSPNKKSIINPIKIPVGEGITGRVVLNKKGEIINNTLEDKDYIVDDQIRNSEIAVPILYMDEVIGVIDSEHHEKNFFTEEHFEILNTIAFILANKLIQARQYMLLQNRQFILEKEVVSRTDELEKELVERLKTEKELLAVKDNLEQINATLIEANDELRSFSYVVSHDLKSPLRALSTLVWFIESDLGCGRFNDVKNNLSLMKGRINRMNGLIEGLLEFSKLGFDQSESRLLDIKKLLHPIIADFKKKWNFEIILPDAFPEVYYPHHNLTQVFYQLISNGVKFNARENKLIEISWKQIPGFIKFEVADNGPGISRKFHKKIFEIFQTLQSKDSFESTGIGLAIVKRIIEKRGGVIIPERSIYKGTKMVFTIPIK